jgi:hypothetical protein
MPRKLVNVNGHLFGFDDKTGDYFTVDYKKVPLRAAPEDEVVALSKALSKGTAIIWEDPTEKEEDK